MTKRWLMPVLALTALLASASIGFAERDGSGTYSVPTTATSGGTISSSDWNTNFDDVGDEITNSLPRDGQAGMTGQLKAATGTVGAPGITFLGDLDSGFYRIGADNWGFALSGSKVLDLSASTVAITGNVTISGSVTAGSGIGAGTVPAGSISAYGGNSAPTGWLLCDGSAISRTTYDTLFGIIGTNYGSGDGSTTFNVPDLRGRVLAGQDDMGGTSANRLTGLTNGVNGDTMGASGGLESFTLATTNIPSHTHSFSATTSSNGSHDHGISNAGGTDSMANGGNSMADASSGSTDTDGSHTHTISGTTGSSGSTTAMGHIQPTTIVNYIIYTGEE
jgi:microcystin-dependent protein